MQFPGLSTVPASGKHLKILSLFVIIVVTLFTWSRYYGRVHEDSKNQKVLLIYTVAYNGILPNHSKELCVIPFKCREIDSLLRRSSMPGSDRILSLNSRPPLPALMQKGSELALWGCLSLSLPGALTRSRSSTLLS